MRERGKALVIGILALLVLWVLGGSIYIVSETEQVVITQFGDPVGDPITEPGVGGSDPFAPNSLSY